MIMMKFTDKSTRGFGMSYFYSAMSCFVDRTGSIITQLERFQSMKGVLNTLWGTFDDAYKWSQKSHLTKSIADLDVLRDKYAYVIENVAKLWARLPEDELNIHGRRVAQVFKDYQFRVDEALVSENAKVKNIEQVFDQETYVSDLDAMGLTPVNELLKQSTVQIDQLMSQRNEEMSGHVDGQLKAAREALEAHYRAMITYLNAVQEIQPEESISLAAQYYNEDLDKIENQIAQSRGRSGKGKSGSSSSGKGSGSSQTGTVPADSGNESGNSGTGTDDSGNESGNSGNNSGDSGNESGNSGNNSGESGSESGNSGTGGEGSGDNGGNGGGNDDPDNGME